MRANSGHIQTIGQSQNLPIGTGELRAAEKAKQFYCSQFATLLAEIPHLNDGEKQAADDNGSTEYLGYVGKAGKVIHLLLLV